MKTLFRFSLTVEKKQTQIFHIREQQQKKKVPITREAFQR